ncbi:MAG: hypothetical protein VCE74_19585 [Alphaproteobacteria bacterium]
MKCLKTNLLACGLALAIAAPALAKTEKFDGTSCWSGKMTVLATTKADMGWAFTMNYTWLADDKDPKNSMAGRCVGSGGLVAGKFQAAPFFCNVNAADGSTYMVTGTGIPSKLDGILFGGTGAFEGISGTVKGGQQIDLPAPQGEFAACRPQTVERTTPG